MKEEEILKEFDENKLKTLLGGYCWSQDGGNGGYDYEDIKNFISQSLDQYLQSYKEELVKEIEKMDCWLYGDVQKENVIKIINNPS